MNSSTHRNSGFTIIEIIVTILIIGILLGIVVVSTTSFSNRSKKTEAVSTAEEVKLKLSTYFQNRNRYPHSQSAVVTYLQSVNSDTLATKFNNTATFEYRASTADNRPCQETGGDICDKYEIIVSKSAWKGSASDTDVTIRP